MVCSNKRFQNLLDGIGASLVTWLCCNSKYLGCARRSPPNLPPTYPVRDGHSESVQKRNAPVAAGSIKNVRPPPLIRHPIHGVRATARQQCNRDRRSRKGGRLRSSRVSANGIYDTNDPQSYIPPVRRQRTASQVDELWDRWRVVEVKKRRRT